MRYCLFFCALILLTVTGICQKPKRSVGLYTSFLLSGSIPSQADKVTITQNKFLLGAEYAGHINKWLQLCSGIEFSDHYILRATDQTTPATQGHVQFVSVPVYLRTDVLKYFFFTFGTIIDLKLNNDIIREKSTFGLTGGAGFQINGKRLGFFIHPYYQLHCFKAGESSIFNLDLRTGISYRF